MCMFLQSVKSRWFLKIECGPWKVLKKWLQFLYEPCIPVFCFGCCNCSLTIEWDTAFNGCFTTCNSNLGMKGLQAIGTRAAFYRQKMHYSFTLIILLSRYDFFLVSQSVRQGTVSPTHFNVIEDNSGLKPDHLQRLSYKLTHLYYNWPVSEIIKIQ